MFALAAACKIAVPVDVSVDWSKLEEARETCKFELLLTSPDSAVERTSIGLFLDNIKAAEGDEGAEQLELVQVDENSERNPVDVQLLSSPVNSLVLSQLLNSPLGVSLRFRHQPVGKGKKKKAQDSWQVGKLAFEVKEEFFSTEKEREKAGQITVHPQVHELRDISEEAAQVIEQLKATPTQEVEMDVSFSWSDIVRLQMKHKGSVSELFEFASVEEERLKEEETAEAAPTKLNLQLLPQRTFLVTAQHMDTAESKLKEEPLRLKVALTYRKTKKLDETVVLEEADFSVKELFEPDTCAEDLDCASLVMSKPFLPAHAAPVMTWENLAKEATGRKDFIKYPLKEDIHRQFRSEVRRCLALLIDTLEATRTTDSTPASRRSELLYAWNEGHFAEISERLFSIYTKIFDARKKDNIDEAMILKVHDSLARELQVVIDSELVLNEPSKVAETPYQDSVAEVEVPAFEDRIREAKFEEDAATQRELLAEEITKLQASKNAAEQIAQRWEQLAHAYLIDRRQDPEHNLLSATACCREAISCIDALPSHSVVQLLALTSLALGRVVDIQNMCKFAIETVEDDEEQKDALLHWTAIRCMSDAEQHATTTLKQNVRRLMKGETEHVVNTLLALESLVAPVAHCSDTCAFAFDAVCEEVSKDKRMSLSQRLSLLLCASRVLLAGSQFELSTQRLQEILRLSFEASAEIVQSRIAAWTVIGQCEVAKGNFKRARDALKNYLKSIPGTRLSRRKRPEDAIPLEEAIDLRACRLLIQVLLSPEIRNWTLALELSNEMCQ
ncbi:MAG: hypothetical protein MHM6MM_005795 [Cercozoa sp. M6MM]